MPIETQCSPFLDDGCNFSGDQNCQSDLEKDDPSNQDQDQSQNPGGRHLARIIKEILKKVNPENQDQDQYRSQNPGGRLLLEMQR